MRLTILMLFFLPILSYAQNDTLYKASVQELMSLKVVEKETDVSVGSFKATAIRQTPAIVSLITTEQIQHSGARDLVDLLRTVQGIDFAQNYDNVAGIGIRGNWGEEGKVLLLVDGQIMNETSFGSIMYGQRYPLANIERIEIIRGAGSAVYGGMAGLSVIHIISKTNKTQAGTHIFTQMGISEGGLSRTSAQFTALQKLRNQVGFDLSAAYNRGNRSNRQTQDFLGKAISFRDSSEIESVNLNAAFTYKDFEMRFIYNDYAFRSLGFADENGEAVNNTSKDLMLSLNHHVQLQKFKISPYFRLKYHRPWWYENYQHLAGRAIYDGYRMSNFRYNVGAVAKLELDNTNLSFGADFYRETARYEAHNFIFYNGQKTIGFNNFAFFGEINHISKFVNITVGGRIEKNNAYDWAFAPRLALTKVLGNFHGKILASYAFKAPTIQNLQYARNNQINPEFIRSLEAEIGWRASEKFQIAANVFHVRIEEPIVYVFNATTFEQYYDNLGLTGTQGIEWESHFKHKYGYLRANYSFYTPTFQGVPNYVVENRDDAFLGLPAHKLNLNAHLKLKNYSLNSNFIYWSEKHTYGYFGRNFTDYRLQAYPATYRWDLNVNYKDLFVKGLQISFHVYNLTNEMNWLINPVDNTNVPTPEQGREWVLRITYDLNAN